MKRLLVSIFFIIIVLSIIISNLYASYAVTRSDEFKTAKQIAKMNNDFEVVLGNIFVATPLQYVFLLEKEDNLYWSFVTNETVEALINASDGISSEEIIERLEALKIPMFEEIYQLTPGLIKRDSAELPYYATLTDTAIVWEVIGLNSNDRVQYTYFDFFSGKLIWNYQLQ
ncbi:hypothetical protein [Desulfuribacillus alkaliarsenatis]|uniref:DUF5590 domain-containing protein n=1 Tax=Desulfuribacillus alkaliarsenatis TaxID=766136 RepID=A0A1E5FZW3_9FIRM|nr:hypothetical protein [Desulfuribacillus alkaliarsenatis]OEF95989.1 hypothetical protein BHF68_09570 [Desulfuribacillus alkaliarsenatis]